MWTTYGTDPVLARNEWHRRHKLKDGLLDLYTARYSLCPHTRNGRGTSADTVVCRFWVPALGKHGRVRKQRVSINASVWDAAYCMGIFESALNTLCHNMAGLYETLTDLDNRMVPKVQNRSTKGFYSLHDALHKVPQNAVLHLYFKPAVQKGITYTR